MIVIFFPIPPLVQAYHSIITSPMVHKTIILILLILQAYAIIVISYVHTVYLMTC